MTIQESVEIDNPGFVDMWNLLDILLLCGNEEQCDPGLTSALIEELFDSTSIDGCRLVFDYLESRRELLTLKHFGAKQTRNLVTLRSCSELLRRLSRADEAVFSGRVFIFLFQTFPLGEKGWVNHKGEFNLENITTYNLPTPANEDSDAAMRDAESAPPASKPVGEPMAIDKPSFLAQKEANRTPGKGGASSKLDINNESALREFYPSFWSMQEVFTNPLRIEDADAFNQFKSALGSTIDWFRSIPNVSAQVSGRDEGFSEGQSLEVDSDGNPLDPDVINQKYLTNFELFKLEV